jgi:hypothetical protein
VRARIRFGNGRVLCGPGVVPNDAIVASFSFAERPALKKDRIDCRIPKSISGVTLRELALPD